MSLEITGKLIVKGDTQQVSDKFKKREFVLELAEEVNGNIYTNFAKMQLVQNKCDILDRFKEGEIIKASFNIKGNRWEKDGKVNYISNLDAWRIESATSGATNTAAPASTYPAQSYGGNAAPPAFGATNTANGPVSFNAPSEVIDDLPF